MKIDGECVVRTVSNEIVQAITSVMENINDPFTDNEKKRKISLDIELTPSTKDDNMDIKVKTDLTLVPRERRFVTQQLPDHQMSFDDYQENVEE